MVAIKIKKGLDIPIEGKPSPETQKSPRPLIPSGEVYPLTRPKHIALSLTEFSDLKFNLLVDLDQEVVIGQPLVEAKKHPGLYFVSPAAGKVAEIRRGYKRALTYVVIETAENEAFHQFPPLDPSKALKEELIERLSLGGGFSHIGKRPFCQLASPQTTPRSIFVKALESLPFVPPAEMQVEGREELFQAGLDTLKRLTTGPVHLIYRAGSQCRAFTEAKNVHLHTAEGPHPVSNFSLHIQALDPITSPDDVIWTVSVLDVLVIGSLVKLGRYFIDRIIGIGGPAVVPDQIGYYSVREGFPIEALLRGRVPSVEAARFISGDPLTGQKVESDDFLGFNAKAFVVLEEPKKRKLLHFFRLGFDVFSLSRGYGSGHLNPEKQAYKFTTSQHGEKRPIIDGSQYDKVQPLDIPTVPLVKALMAENYDLAEKFGLLEVAPEDFALPTFVCPSKVEMTELVKQGLARVAEQH